MRSVWRNRRRPALLLAVPLVAAACVVAGCTATSSGSNTTSSSTGTATAGTPKDGGTLTATITVAPDNLDPILGGSGGDEFSLYPIFDRLVNFTKDLKAAPGLASSWNYPDPKTLVMHLRTGVKFTDGTPFNAAAVKFNLDRARTLKTSTVIGFLAPITSIDATTPSEVTIHFNEPDTALPLILTDRAGMMASPTAVKKEGSKFSLKPVGTGPFTLKSYAPGSSMTLAKNPNYWQKGKPYLNGIQLNYIPDGQTAVNSVLGGQNQFATNVASSYVQALNGNPNVKVSTGQSLAEDGCYFNFSKAPFNSTDARLAMQSALDPSAINNALYFGKGVPSSQLVPPSYWAYQKNLPKSLYNPTKAKQLAKSSGLTGTTVSLLGYNAPNQSRKLQIIQSQLKAIGVKSTVQIEEVGAGVTDFYTNHKFDAFCSGWTAQSDPSETFTGLISPKSYYNTGGYDAGNVDALIAAGQKDTALSARSAAYLPLAKTIQDKAVWLPLVFAPGTSIMTPKVKGYVPNLAALVDVSFFWLS